MSRNDEIEWQLGKTTFAPVRDRVAVSRRIQVDCRRTDARNPAVDVAGWGEYQSLKDELAEAAPGETTAETLEKDRHLIEAALAADKPVASLDEEVRRCLRGVARRIPDLKTICWVNPGRPEESAVAWLERGAPADKTRTLGHIPPRSAT